MNRRHAGRPSGPIWSMWWLVPVMLVLAVAAATFLAGVLEDMPALEQPLLAELPSSG